MTVKTDQDTFADVFGDVFGFEDLLLEELSVTAMRDGVALADTAASCVGSTAGSCAVSSCCCVVEQ